MDKDLCESLYYDIFSGLERVGFKVIMALGGHYPSGDMLRGIAQRYQRRSDIRLRSNYSGLFLTGRAGSPGYGKPWLRGRAGGE